MNGKRSHINLKRPSPLLQPANERGSRLLEQAAAWAEALPCVVAPTLAAYRQRHGLDARGLAAYLGCSVTALQGLALCHRPRPTSVTFAADVRRLAAYIGCHADRLAVVLRHAEEA